MRQRVTGRMTVEYTGRQTVRVCVSLTYSGLMTVRVNCWGLDTGTFAHSTRRNGWLARLVHELSRSQ